MSEHKKFKLSPSVSIIIAGVIVAGAIVFANTNSIKPASSAQQVKQPLPSTETNVRAPSAEDHIVGSLDAPLVLIEYSDFECPYCALIHPTFKRLVSESNGNIAWVYRHLPLESLHPQARTAALASECVASQLGNEEFWAFVEAMFANQKSMSASYYEQVAASLGADMTAFKSCVSAKTFASRVDTDSAEAMQNGGQGTPYTVLFDKKGQVGVSGALPYETFSALISTFKSR
jgi:protein-disulfide isomerase